MFVIYEADGKTVANMVQGASEEPGLNIQPGTPVGIGWVRQDDGSFLAPPPPPPILVERTKRELRLWIRGKGKEAQYDALLASLTGQPKQDWEDALTLSWEDPTVQGLRSVAVTVLGMTEAEQRACFEE